MKKFNSKTAIQCSAFVCALIILSQVSMAGNLEPNAPPGSTMKPLDQVEPRIPITSVPYTISQSGSYYLTKNLTAAGTAITVNADNVTIDLCGFSLAGNNTGSGIYMTDRINVEIRNGTISNFSYGINDDFITMVSNGTSTNHRVIGVRALSNANFGIKLYGPNNEVRDCSASNNGTSASGSNIFGISVANNSTVTGNTVSNNGGSAQVNAYVFGILAGYNCTITGNAVGSNGYNAAAGTTVYGITANSSSTITGNTVSGNGTSAGSVYGIAANNGGSTITGNTVCGNGSSATVLVHGIYASSGGTVTGNTAYLNGQGMSAGSGTVDGIYAGSGCTVIGNTVYSNGAFASGTVFGIYLAGNSLVDQNTAYNNNGTNMTHPANCTYGSNYAP
ncbi:MAG: hypothetical protein ABSB11_11235 [Sedimentisphaerales bacterium]